MNIRERAKKLKADIPAVCMALAHPKTPWYAKVLAFLTVAYALSPIDLIPDFIPVLGYLDDVILLPVMIALTLKCVPADVISECRERAMARTPVSARWYYALPVALFWLICLSCAVKLLL